MMKDIRNSRLKIVFVLFLAALVVVYLYVVAPFFLGKIDDLRAENKQIEYDLKELDKIGSDTASIESDIAEAKTKLKIFEKRVQVDGTNYDMDISAKADKSDVKITEIAVGGLSAVGEKSTDGKILYLQPITVSFTGKSAEGIDFIKKLEKSETGIYKIKDFLYTRGTDKKETKSWIINVDVYYYGDENLK